MTIFVTRFDNKTWEELQSYKNKYEINETSYLYPVPLRIKDTVPIKKYILVLEMNNSLNKIMGISYVLNYLKLDKYYDVYSDKNYNRYTYKGNKRIGREHMNRITELIIQIFEEILFKGKGHCKRGQGITSIPDNKYNKYKINNESLDNYLLSIFIPLT